MKKTHKVKKKISANNRVYVKKWTGWLVILLSLAGIGISLYLYSLHVDLLKGEIKGGFLCGAADNAFGGCHSVASSSYSSMMGIPLAALGAMFFSTLALLGLGGIIFLRDCGQAFFRWAFLLAVSGLAFDLYLAHAMIFKIGAVCWLCTATYVVNLAIVITLLRSVWTEPKPQAPLRAIFPGARGASGPDRYYRDVIKGILIGAVLLTSVVGFAGSQFISKTLSGNDRELLAKIKESFLKQNPTFIDVTDRPFLGPAEAKLTVIEFSDFMCPHCSKGSDYLKLAQSVNHDAFRLVFLHFPLDKACNPKLTSNVHPGACLLAEASACANEQGEFWQYHDIAFETKGKISRSVVVGIASDLKLDLEDFGSCLDSGRGRKVVMEDINTAINAGVVSTPILYINGRKLNGVPKPWVLNEILEFSEENIATPR